MEREKMMEDLWIRHSIAWHRNDVEGVLATYCDDGIYHLIPTDTGGRGKKQLRQAYNCMSPPNFTNLEQKIISRVISGTKLMEESYCTFLHLTECKVLLPGILPSYRFLSLMANFVLDFVFEAASGSTTPVPKIKILRIYWDHNNLLDVVSGRSAARTCEFYLNGPSNRAIPQLMRAPENSDDQEEYNETKSLANAPPSLPCQSPRL